MNYKSERAYWWIDARVKGLSKWIDTNPSRILIITIFTWLAIWGFLLEGQDNLSTWQRLIRSLGPSLAGIVIAAVTIEALAERRQEQERKAQLIRQLGSKYRDLTEMAVIELSQKGWLGDGSVNRADLLEANLSGADLHEANLSLARLRRADLSGTDLHEANLSRASLGGANLSGANLDDVNLSGANVWKANLSEARLGNANLSGADLTETNLSGANLWRVNLSGARLEYIDLSKAVLWEANLSGTNLYGANLKGADLRGAKGWTIEQLEQANSLKGTIMPDEVQLSQEETENQKHIEGPTFGEWKAQYLSEHGGTVTDIRDRERTSQMIRTNSRPLPPAAW